MKGIFLSVWLLMSLSVYGLDDNELPSPLTFKETISFAKKEFHYTFLLARSEIDSAQANALASESENDLSIYLEGYLRKVGVSDFTEDDQDNDSKISLLAIKNLYDFGLSSSKNKHKKLLIETKVLKYKLEQERYLKRVIEAYFNVLRSDNNFLTENEAMAIAFVSYKNIQDNIEFGLSSDLVVLKAQTNYELARQRRYLSEIQQRFTRQYLAELLGSTNIPDELSVPDFSRQQKIIDDVDTIINLVLNNSKNIRLVRVEIQAVKQELVIASLSQSGNIEAELEISDYQRQSSFRDDWRASINFNFPIYTGDRKKAATLNAQANYQVILAKLKESESLLRIKVLELWQSINQKSVELEGAIIQQDYRDLYLEQSRADYELEYKSDLGDAMVEFTRSRAQRYNIVFDLEMAWQELTMLVGSDNLNLLYKK